MKSNKSFICFKAALKAGASLGLFLGHLDLLNRIAAKKLEWFEVYQCLLLPLLLTMTLFALLFLAITVLSRLNQSKLRPEGELAAYGFISLSGMLIIAIGLLTHFFVSGDLLIWDPKRYRLNAVYLATVCGCLVLLRCRYSAPVESLASKFLGQRWVSHYLFLILFFCAGCLTWDYFEYRWPHYTHSLTEVHPEESPNVIFLSLDTVRADHLGTYGYSRNTTPFLDSLAQESAVFDFALATSSWTLPSHASVFTGNYSYRHGAIETHQKLDRSALTLAEILRDRGYHTAGFIGGPYVKAKYGIGQGFEYYHDRLDFFEYRHTHDILGVKNILDFVSRDLRMHLLQNDGERLGHEIGRDVSRWLEHKPDGPFFLFINYFDAHDPYDQGKEYLKSYLPDFPNTDALNQYVRSVYFDPMRYHAVKPSPETREKLVAMYDAEIRTVDDHLRALFQALQARGFLDNSIVVIFSDHGEEFFEHGGLLHKQTLYQEVLRVPLIVYAPGRVQPGVYKEPVSLVDVLPTLLGMLSREVPPDVDGVDLFSQSASASKRYILAERYARREHGESELRAVTDGSYKYISSSPEQARIPTALYDLTKDPGEQQSVLSEEQALAKQLEDVLGVMNKDKAVLHEGT